ncbi:MAG: helix-turn-helix domain-containing protein [Pseudoalteromonas sp.]|uniref:helix-turn-helix domain-containing protein n=1 Tax=Pseudoalteromonas sp. TaxID=53249 RepID=UPI001D673080|nr:helix-turn-helix domain-containing protein [Pseudoalteromonas sp.]NRA82190.1 helix-turn-helix domain-containing protein [Pseudoalteromonas sp.]
MTADNYKSYDKLMTYITLDSDAVFFLNDMCMHLDLDQKELVKKLIFNEYVRNKESIETSREALRVSVEKELKKWQPGKRTKNINKPMVLKLYEEGERAVDIAEKLAIGRSTVFKIVKEAKI